MKTRDIEDVLSSIRRLVTEENAVTRAARMERLVLTPALRVLPPPANVDDDPPPFEPEANPIGIEAAFPPFEATRVSDVDVAARDEPSLEERIATLEAAISRSDDEFEPDGSEEVAALTPGTIPFPAAEAAPAAAPEPPEPTRATREPAPRHDAAPTIVPEPPREPASRHDAAPAIAPEPPPAPEPQPATHRAPAIQAGTALEEALIDEDSLREIVSQLVREELRGEMGERITRNVRRLIRREIAQALALKDLEAED